MLKGVLSVLLTTAVGWDSIGAGYKTYFTNATNFTDEERPRKSFTNHIIKFFGNVAWVVYDIHADYKYEGNDYSLHSKDMRIYEKKNDRWKIVFQHSGRAINEKPSQTEVDLQIAGNRLLTSDQVEKAIEVFKVKVKLFPESTNTHRNLANAYLKQGNDELAMKHCEKALKLNPLNSSAIEMMEKM